MGLSVLAFGDTAAVMFNNLAREAGKGLGRRAAAAIPAEALQAVNRTIGRTIVTKYGMKRGIVALGNALPIGFGVVIGGGGNYMLIRNIGRHADSFFAQLAPPAVTVDP